MPYSPNPPEGPVALRTRSRLRLESLTIEESIYKAIEEAKEAVPGLRRMLNFVVDSAREVSRSVSRLFSAHSPGLSGVVRRLDFSPSPTTSSGSGDFGSDSPMRRSVHFATQGNQGRIGGFRSVVASVAFLGVLALSAVAAVWYFGLDFFSTDDTSKNKGECEEQDTNFNETSKITHINHVELKTEENQDAKGYFGSNDYTKTAIPSPKKIIADAFTMIAADINDNGISGYDEYEKVIAKSNYLTLLKCSGFELEEIRQYIEENQENDASVLLGDFAIEFYNEAMCF